MLQMLEMKIASAFHASYGIIAATDFVRSQHGPAGSGSDLR